MTQEFAKIIKLKMLVSATNLVLLIVFLILALFFYKCIALFILGVFLTSTAISIIEYALKKRLMRSLYKIEINKQIKNSYLFVGCSKAVFYTVLFTTIAIFSNKIYLINGMQQLELLKILFVMLVSIVVISILYVEVSLKIQSKFLKGKKTKEIEKLFLQQGFNVKVVELREKQAPAMALTSLLNNKIYFTSKLKNILLKKEFKAILFHELGHLKIKRKIMFWLFTLIFIGAVVPSLFQNNLLISMVVSAITLLIMIVGLIKLRKFNEIKADEFAKQIAGKKAFASALTKVYKANKMPIKLPFETFLPHQNIKKRVK